MERRIKKGKEDKEGIGNKDKEGIGNMEGVWMKDKRKGKIDKNYRFKKVNI